MNDPNENTSIPVTLVMRGYRCLDDMMEAARHDEVKIAELFPGEPHVLMVEPKKATPSRNPTS